MASDGSPEPLIRSVDCVQIPVASLDDALAFYRDRLRHDLVWRSETAAGLRLLDSNAEIVLQTERPNLEPNLLVDSADKAAERFVDAGGSVVVPPFDIQVGRCTVVRDPWGNTLVLLDLTKGRFTTDERGNITGNESP